MVKKPNNAAERTAQRFSLVYLSSLNRHKSKTHITPSQHILQVKLDLGKTVSSKTRIYLDTKYWLMFRDTKMRHSRIKDHQALFQKLSELVKSGRVVCPVSDMLLSELLTQSDSETRMATAEVMDQLSGGIAIVTLEERIQTEILHWLRMYTLPKEVVLPLNQLVWTKSAHFYGYALPIKTGFPLKDEATVQKAWFDTLGLVSIADLLRSMGSDNITPLLNPPDIACKLNEEKFTNTVSGYSFKELLLYGIRDGVDAYWPYFRTALASLFESTTSKRATMTDDDEIRKITTNLIVAAIENEKIGAHLPSLRILTGIIAAIRWNSNRKYKRGDWMDMMHAAIALPYCDVFLTDRSFATLLCNPPLKYDHLYNTSVASTEMDAFSVLDKLYKQYT